jgi:hypothetical protein
MGWLYTQGQSKEELVRDCVSGGAHPTGFNALAHSLRGNQLWVVFENETSTVVEKGFRFIALYLLASEKGYGWGYKSMDESCGPYYFNCPLSYLDMVPEPPKTTSSDFDWRANVRKFHETNRMAAGRKKSLKVGDTLRLPEGFSPREVKIIMVGKKLRGMAHGITYRITPKVLKHRTANILAIRGQKRHLWLIY